MLVMAALNHGLSRLFDDLLTFTEGSEIYCAPIPKAYVGNSFRKLVSDLSLNKEVIVMAVKRGDRIFTNPVGEFRLEKGDQVYLLAEQYPQWFEDYVAPGGGGDGGSGKPAAKGCGAATGDQG
jgi:hypothetical protein